MRKFNKIISGFCIAALVTSYSCNTFENEPLDRLTEDYLFNPNDSLASSFQQLFFAVYEQLPSIHNRIDNNYLDAGTDDAIPTVYNTGNTVDDFRNGQQSSTNTIEGADAWKRNYTGIRHVNLFLSKAAVQPTGKILSAEMLKYMKGESMFLRAYYYFELFKRWGGVPIVGDIVYQLEDKVEIPRSTQEQTVAYIKAQLDEAMNFLPEASLRNTTNYDQMNNRANKGSALALRARINLYLASPLYNPTNDKAKWEAAANAAKAVIDTKEYSLHNIVPGFVSLFITPKNNEVIFGKLLNSTANTNLELANSPCGYFDQQIKSLGYVSPSQNLVDAFLTINGKTIDKDPAYKPETPYENRDPRLKYTVFYNGTMWLNRSVETFEGGKDKPNRGTKQTQTAYYLRKFLGNNETSSTYAAQKRVYPIIRYAEVLLNYVEALNEIDPTQPDIINYLKQIRQRAEILAGPDGRYGLPLTFSQAEMREIIRNERRIELAFEEHRFWDIRRWKIAEIVMNQPIKGIFITKQADGKFIYAIKNVREQQFDASRMYWYPIPRTEMEANSKLTQNPGWNY